MDLSSLYKSGKTGFTGYRIPASFELAGKSFDVAFDGEAGVRLVFAAAPKLEVSTGAGGARPYKCVKIGPSMFFVSFTDGSICTFLAVDTENNLVTRLVTDASAKTIVSLGVMDAGKSEVRHIATDDFAGNIFEWAFGPESAYIASVKYGEKSVSVSLPFAKTAVPGITVSDFAAVRLEHGVYLQTAVVVIDGQAFSVALATDLNNLLCMGGIFGVQAGNITHETIGGYGNAAKL